MEMDQEDNMSEGSQEGEKQGILQVSVQSPEEGGAE